MNLSKFSITVLSILFLLAGCVKITDIKIEHKKMIAVLGEISSADSVMVHLFQAQSLNDTNSNWKPFEAVNVKLTNTAGKELATLVNRGNGKWSAPYIIPVNEKDLALKITDENRNWTIATTIPHQFLATILNQQELSENNTDISLQLQNTDSVHKYYVIEYLQKKSPTSMELIDMESSDVNIDNNIYKELGSTFYRIFLHTAHDKATIKIRLSKISRDENYILRVKSVTALYYKYLYKYEIQKNRQNLTTPFISLSPAYLGVWSGFVKNDLILRL